MEVRSDVVQQSLLAGNSANTCRHSFNDSNEIYFDVNDQFRLSRDQTLHRAAAEQKVHENCVGWLKTSARRGYPAMQFGDGYARRSLKMYVYYTWCRSLVNIRSPAHLTAYTPTSLARQSTYSSPSPSAPTSPTHTGSAQPPRLYTQES